MKIAHFADLHFGCEDRNALEAASSLVREMKVNAIVVAGDLTQRGKREEFEAAQDWLSRFSVPILCVPGNHDTPLLNLPARAADAFGRYDRYFSGRAGPLELEGISIRGLNTSRGWQTRMNWAEGRVNLDDLDRAISASGVDAVHVLACHHPFLSPAKASLQTATKRGEEASRRVAGSPVQIVLNGHVHTPHAELVREHAGNYLAITAGTLSTRLRAQPPSFNILSIRDGMLVLNVQSYSDNHFQEATHGCWDMKTLEPISTPRVVSI